MADQPKFGLFSAFFRYFRFWSWKKARGIADAADAQFTNSVDGIKAGFDMHNDALVGRYRDLRNAIATFETALETKRGRAKDIQDKIVAKEKILNGALSIIEKARAANDEKGAAEALKDAAEFQGQLKQMHADLDAIEADLGTADTRKAALVKQLQDMKKEIGNLDQEKADAIADFVSDKAIIDTLDRLDGLSTTVDRGPIDAIRKANKERAAQARVAQNMHTAETTDTDAKYAEAGEASSSHDDIEAMLASRAAAKAKTGEGDAKPADREKI